MEDRLFDALETVKERLPYQYKNFLEALERISENVNYMDANEYEEWSKDESADGLEAYVLGELKSFVKREFVVLWVNEECDRNENGEVTGGYEEGYYDTLSKAITAANKSERSVEAGREIVIVDRDEFFRSKEGEPLTIEWTNQPDRYLDEVER